MIQAFALTSSPRKLRPPVVDDVSFEARAGHVTALLGAPGAGKSTLLRLMLELQQGRGATHFKGRPLHRIAQPAREVGVLLGEVAGHPARTVRGHLRMLCAAAGVPARRANQVLEVVGLADLRGERLGALEPGANRRLGLACALLADPHTLVLDDPADSLTAVERRWLHGMLRAHAAQGGTVLIATATPEEAARAADRVLSLEQGRLVAQQTSAEFSRTRLRPRITVRTPHAARLAALLTHEARSVRRATEAEVQADARAGAEVQVQAETRTGVEVVLEGGNHLHVYGSTCADIGEAAFRHGVVVHQLSADPGDMDPAPELPLPRPLPLPLVPRDADAPPLLLPPRLPTPVPPVAPDPVMAAPEATEPTSLTSSECVPTLAAEPHTPEAGPQSDATPQGDTVPQSDTVTPPPPREAESHSGASLEQTAPEPSALPVTQTTPFSVLPSPATPPPSPLQPLAAQATLLQRATPSVLPPAISVRTAPSPRRPLRYELRRAAGIGAGFLVGAAVLIGSALIAVLLARFGHVPQHRLLAAWPRELPLPPAALGAGLLGALAFGDEFRHPALAADRRAVPRRLGLLAAKLAVSTATALLLAFLTVGCDAEVLYLVYGPDLAKVPTDWLSLGASWIGLVVGCAWAGVLAAGVFRSTSAGLAAVIVVPAVAVPLVPVVQRVLGSPAVRDAAETLLQVRASLLSQWPFGGERYLVAAARVLAQPMGGALALSLTALLCSYLLTTLRSRVRDDCP
ncbi:ATP-binding cassette domain-containing protein [Streptomyces sp. NPDC090106]|uniref:ATP-binding cassette domain-containing protein n=1 Tax=Streptomyces sp. NPDC090106 TaxID=3365946 RepID=UPI003818C3CB